MFVAFVKSVGTIALSVQKILLILYYVASTVLGTGVRDINKIVNIFPS